MVVVVVTMMMMKRRRAEAMDSGDGTERRLQSLFRPLESQAENKRLSHL